MTRATTIFAATLIVGSAFASVARAEDSSSSFDSRLGTGYAGSSAIFSSRSVAMQRKPQARTMNRASQVRDGGAR